MFGGGGERPKITVQQAALFAGVYLVFGLLALGYMTMSYGRPPLAAFIPVCLIPIGIFVLVLVLNQRR